MTSERYQLRILGAPDLRAPDGRRLGSVLAQPSRLSLLAYLALAPGPVTRATVVADFWPDSDEVRARNALSQALFHLRRSLDKDTVVSVEGDRLWVPPDRLWCDARALLTESVPSRELTSAAEWELLAGWNAEASQPLQEWLDGQRRRIRERVESLRAAHHPSAGSVVDSTPPSSAALPGRSGRPRWLPVVGAGLAALTLAVVIPRIRGEPSISGNAIVAEAAYAPAPNRLAVLYPRVTVNRVDTSVVGEAVAVTLNAQLIAMLPEMTDVQVVAMPYASSLQSLTRQRTEIFGPGEDLPDWILDVGVGVTESTAHATAILYRGADFSAPGREAFDVPLDNASELTIAAPRAIAARVAEMVRSVLSLNPHQPQP